MDRLDFHRCISALHHDICTLEVRYTWSWHRFKYTDDLFRHDYGSGLLSESACSTDRTMPLDKYRRSNLPFVNLPAAIAGSNIAVGPFTVYCRLLNLDSDTLINEPSAQEIRHNLSFAKSSARTKLELYLPAIYSTITTMHLGASATITRVSL
jgi:hypothetical protein